MKHIVPCLSLQIKPLFKITIISFFIIFLTLPKFPLLAQNHEQIILHVLPQMFGF